MHTGELAVDREGRHQGAADIVYPYGRVYAGHDGGVGVRTGRWIDHDHKSYDHPSRGADGERSPALADTLVCGMVIYRPDRAADIGAVQTTGRGEPLSRRVAITGVGLVTPIGSSLEAVWESVAAQRSAVRRLTRFDPVELRSQMAAEVRDFEFDPGDRASHTNRLDRFSQFAVTAARAAERDAGLDGSLAGTNTAVYLGSALGGVEYAEEQHAKYVTKGIRAVAPALAVSVFAGAGATNVAIALDLRGPAISNANSCASGAIAIGEAFRLVRAGAQEVALAGGVECPLAPLTFGSFSVIKAMSKLNDEPEAACKPFDLERDGFVMGEGACILVLEEWEHARARGANVLAEVVGYATTNDAYHMTMPRPDGIEAAHAMKLALVDAGVKATEIDYINAHATGTALGDAAEMAGVQRVFGDAMPVISATKPLHGHPLGASPAIELAITVMALRNGYAPATRNLATVDPRCAGSHVPQPGMQLDMKVALSNAFGFGGTNASVVVKRVA
jgi:3-oxoacyl-[acyl-carrier-protein] synthase II